MASLHPPPVEVYFPATFHERGVSVPFTTPMLAGARVRQSRRGGMEVVVPNPAGRRGAYILTWASVRERCNPTVHDSLLFTRINTLHRLDPATVRDAAWAVAHEGFAGRQARHAAEAAAAADQIDRLHAEYHLALGLFRAADRSDASQAPPPLPTTEAARAVFERRVAAVMPRVAVAFGRTGPQLREALDEIAGAFALIGAGRPPGTARIARLIDRLLATETGIAACGLGADDTALSRLGEGIVTSIRTTAMLATDLAEEARRLASEPALLLKRWFADAAQVRAVALRPAWVLDGWERIGLLFRSAGNPAAQRAALVEMAQLVPALPREVNTWTRTPLLPEALEPVCQVTSHDDGWRTGSAAMGFIGRNERLRAMSL